MNKKKFVVLALMMIAIIVLSSCMFVACNNDDGNGSSTNSTKYEETKNLLIKNGDFHVIDTASTSYPRSLTSWSGAKMYSSGDYKSDVTAGVISLDKALYDANKSKWNDDQDKLYKLLNLNGRYDDRGIYKHSLMVYMPEEGKDEDGKTIHGPTAYGYTSTSFTLTKGAYYRLKVDVLTYNIDGDNEEARGARIYVSSNTYAEIKGIDTKGKWKTYEILLEASPVSSTSLNVMLGLGRCTSSDKTGLSTGYAVFDNLTLEKLEDTEEKTAESVYEEAVELERNDNEFVATATLKVPNGRFDFGTTTISSSGAPNGWSLVSGNSGKDDPAPSAYRHNGIVDLTKFADNYADYAKQYTLQKDVPSGQDAKIDYNAAKELLVNIKGDIFTDERAANIAGSNVFMLSQQILTAQSIKSARTITIERNKTYALSLDIFTYNVHGAGVSLILTGSDGKDIVIKGISANKSEDYLVGNTAISVSGDKGLAQPTTVEGKTTGGWRTYTFYIQGNQFKNYSYNMNVWLGTEGTNSNTSVSCELSPSSSSKTTLYNANGTFSNGWAFIDELNLKEIESLPSVSTGVIEKATDNVLDCENNDDLRGLIVELTSENMFANILNTESEASSTNNKVSVLGNGAPKGWKSNFDATKKTNPIIDGFISEGVVSLENEGSFAHDTEKVSGLTYPELPYEINDKRAYMLHASSDSYYEVETDNITIKANNYYRISLWVKTQDVKSTSGAYIYVLQKNEDEDDSTLATFSKVNTADYDEYQNDWCEITVAIAGANDKDVTIAFKFTLGTGTRWTSSTLAKGAMYVANINGSTVSHSTYSNTSTGTYTKAIDLTSSTSTAFKNGGFDNYDLDDKNLEEGKALAEQTVAATPSDWTINDNKLGANTEDSDLIAGVIKFNQQSNEDGTFTFVPSNQAKAVFQYNTDVNFNGFYPTVGKNTNELELGSLPGDKGHVLAIGNKKDSSKGYAAGFASSSVTLSANTYYKISLYAKTVGATKATIYLTGESSLTSGTSSFKIESTSDTKWTKYTFYIEVGQTSVSTKLNLWLGENVDYANIEVTDAEVEAERTSNPDYDDKTDKEVIRKALKAQKAASTGNVFFDNVYYTSIDEADFNKAEGTEVHKLSFLTDSFDSLSSTIESRGSLSTPNGWTGTTGTNQSSGNTKSGVIYADSAYYEVKNINGTDYVGILGKDYKIDDITISDKEYDAAKDREEYKDMDKDQVVEALQKAKLVEMQQKNWIPVSELYAHNGSKQMLVINNMEKSAYTYSGSSITMKEQSYYEVSVFVRTYGIDATDDETVGAFVELYLGSANETDNPFIFKSIRTANDAGFVEYKFYVKTLNEDVTSVSLKLSLGKYVSDEVNGETVVTGLTSGYAMFDDVTIKKIDETAYDAAEENDFVQKREVSSESKGTSDDDNTDDSNNTTPNHTFNTEALWWMIPTIVLGLLIIIVVIVYIVRKVRKPIAKKKEKNVATPVETPSLDAKHDKYDDNKE